MGIRVQLRQPWSLGRQIGDPSGFGKVFEAVAENGTKGVVKVIPKQPGADRELLFEDLGGVPNVVPIIDRGETTDSWLMAMPRAERSLRNQLDAANGRLTVEAAVPILMDVARALAELDGRVVHRDLKPENVLLLDGVWSLADFGIARYAEASTGPETWKGFFSAPYAAPERWRFEHATGATDVYSLGIMAFELVMGNRPFPGPAADQFREQHLHEDPPDANGVPTALASLIAECMFKPAQSRPTPANVLARLARVGAPASGGAGMLQAANLQFQAAMAEEHARASVAMSASERRQAMFQAAKKSLEPISGELRQAILENAPAAVPPEESDADEWALKLGDAVIGMDPATISDPGSWGPWRPKMDVVASASIAVTIPKDRHGYMGRAHSIFYCDAQQEGVYRWFETAFMVTPVIPRRTAMDPIAFAPGEDAGKAMSRTMTEWQVAWPFTPIDQGEGSDFIQRWLDWFGRAASGQLGHPSSMPERAPQGSYRD